MKNTLSDLNNYLFEQIERVNDDDLVLIDNEINLELNRRKLRQQEAELTRTGVNIAKLSIATKKAKQRRKKGTTAEVGE